jgi:uncharacterized membrane protein YdjX (TVP38/TMEM64 family)
MTLEPTSEPPEQPRPRRWRIVLLVAIVAGLWIIGWVSGLHEQVDVEEIRSSVLQAGAGGVVLFFALFAIAQVAQLSGHPFIAAAVLVWGWWQGALIAIGAATIGAVVSFAFARGIGGKAHEPKSALMRRILARLEATPMRAIILARVIFMTTPALATAFALSGVRHRDHALATFIGLVPSVFAAAYLWSLGLDWLGLQ